MLRKAHGLGTIQSFVLSEPELCREDTHTKACTHMYTSQTLSNGRNWEIMSIYKSHTLDSKFQFPLNLGGFLGEIVNSMARSGKVQDEPGIPCTKSIKLFKE